MGCVLVAGLAACSSTSPPSTRGAPAAKADPAAMVAAVRATGEQGHELEVTPLRDPQVEDLRAQADAQERAGDYKKAGITLGQALTLTPNDPDLLQWQAELALYRRAWTVAEQFANRSYENGPKLGGLCRRNWTTIQLSRQARGDAAGAEVARAQVASCTVAPPVRM